MKRILTLLVLSLVFASSVDAQQPKSQHHSDAAQPAKARKEVRHGNREYRTKHYDRAEVNYRRAAHDDSTSFRAHYNLGNALYRQKKYDQAAKSYSRALQSSKMSAKDSSRIFHNRGNSNLKAGLQQDSRADGMQQFQQAVNDYQEALKRDPKNDNTRYNLSYAQKMLRQAQQQQQQNGNGQGGGNNQQNQQGNKGQNKQDQNGQDKQNGQNKQNQNSQDQNKQNKGDQGKQDPQQKPDPKQQQQQQRQQQQKKQEAERLLEAVKNNEKNTMKENARRVETAKPRSIEKDW